MRLAGTGVCSGPQGETRQAQQDYSTYFIATREVRRVISS